jgi:hypothetical protein
LALLLTTYYSLLIPLPTFPNISTAVANPLLSFTLLALRDEGSPEGLNSLSPLHFRHPNSNPPPPFE